MNSQETKLCELLLQEHGYRVTSGRVALLLFLKQSKRPLTARELQSGISEKINKVTLYRALEDFTKSKIVTKIHLHDLVTYYEFLHHGHHHHHIVCEKCGKIEDIEHCEQTNIQKEVLVHSKKFSTINSHSLEFFGICNSCEK